MAVTYEPIASTTLGSAAASHTFSSIPGTYTDLVVVFNVRTTVDDANGRLTINSDSGSNYSQTDLEGTGSSAFSGRNSNVSFIPLTRNIGFDDTNPSTGIIQIMSYANTNVFKTVLYSSADFNSSYPGVARRVGLWRSTNAITSIKIETAGTTFKADSTFSLYGIKAA